VLDNIAHERFRQREKWGDQHHPDGTGAPAWRTKASRLQMWNGDTAGTWRDILLEEVYEAMAEASPDRLRRELVQVAAVATAWVEDIDSRKYDNPTADAKAA
jgi:hypothetical protein